MSPSEKSAEYTATIKKVLYYLKDGDEDKEDKAYELLDNLKDPSAKYTVKHITEALYHRHVNEAKAALSNVGDLTAKYIIKRALSYLDVGDIYEAHGILDNSGELVAVTSADHKDMSVKYTIAINKAYCYLEDGNGFKASVVLNKVLMKHARRTPKLWRKRRQIS